MLRCAKDIDMWGSRSNHNFYELIARDKEIVKVVFVKLSCL